jgi:hypothetical protein
VGTLVSARGFLENECSTSRGSFFGVRQFCGSSLAGVGTVQYFFLVSNSRGVSYLEIRDCALQYVQLTTNRKIDGERR